MVRAAKRQLRLVVGRFKRVSFMSFLTEHRMSLPWTYVLITDSHKESKKGVIADTLSFLGMSP